MCRSLLTVGRAARTGGADLHQAWPAVAFREGGVHLVVAPIDYSENMRVLVHGLHSE